MNKPDLVAVSGPKFIYPFETGDGKNKMLLGGKGANLCEMTQIGLNVPPGFTITTEACLAYLEHNRLPAGLMDDIRTHMTALEKKTGKGFGGGDNPLLISVRSGSSMSMPGMMDTILNLGLNDTSLQGLIKQTANPRFAWDAYRRFVQLFGKIALGIGDEHFDECMAATKRKYGARTDLDLDAAHMQELAGEFLAIVKRHTGKPFPQDPYEQLEVAVGAVFRSWSGKRAVDYRRQFRITPQQANGTAVSICTMVFGNMGDDSGTGVGFSSGRASNLGSALATCCGTFTAAAGLGLGGGSTFFGGSGGGSGFLGWMSSTTSGGFSTSRADLSSFGSTITFTRWNTMEIASAARNNRSAYHSGAASGRHGRAAADIVRSMDRA